MEKIAKTPEPPYYAVIFTSLRRSGNGEGYAQTLERMLELARQQPGYLGFETAREAGGLGITVSYWQDEVSIRNWKQNAEHLQAQSNGRRNWYAQFELRICRVERAYGFLREGK